MSDKPKTYDPNKARVVIGGKVIEPLDGTFRTWKTDQQTDHGKIHAETIERKCECGKAECEHCSTPGSYRKG